MYIYDYIEFDLYFYIFSIIILVEAILLVC